MPIEELESPTTSGPNVLEQKKPNVAGKFNYQLFLSLLKQPEARDVVTTIRKFIEAYRTEYSERMSPSEQVARYKEYRDRLAAHIATHPVWLAAGEEAQAMALEGIEYMTMNQIHAKAFSPARSDDAERDEAVDKKMFLYSWIEPEHLDLGIEVDQDVLALAGAEFKRTDEFTTPRDKMVCFMNGVRIISRKMALNGEKLNADLLMPLVILALIKARPARLHANLQYVMRFRNAGSMGGEPAYQMTTLVAASSFIEKLDKKALKVEQDVFNAQMEDAVARYNADSLQQQEEARERHQAEMARKEAEMLRADQASKESEQQNRRSLNRSSSAELKALFGDLGENGSKLVQRVRQSSIIQQSKGIFTEFVTEAKSVVKSLVDESDEDEGSGLREQPVRQGRTLEEEEEYQLQLALAISLSESEAARNKEKAKEAPEDLMN